VFKGIGDFAQQALKVREEMTRMQDVLSKRTVEASSADGKVKVVANGKQRILSVVIEPELLTRDNAPQLQDSLTAAVNHAIQASQEMVKDEMGKMAGDLGPLNALLRGMQ